MRPVLVAALLLFGGCAADAVPADGPDPMAIVWEQTYGMERESRPAVTWHDECRTADGTGNRATSIESGCVISIVYDDGAIELQRAGRISDSAFALALEQWREWLTASSFAPIDGASIASADRALVDAGL